MRRILRTAWLNLIVSIIVTSGWAQAQDTPAPAPQAPASPPPSEAPPSEPPAAAPPAEPSEPAEQRPLQLMPTAPPDEVAPGAPIELAPEMELEAETEPKASPPSEDMVVTGSRIRRKDLSGPAPVIVFTREQIIASGRANIGEFLQSMPEQGNAINRGTNNGGDGAIRLNLRGMGPKSTLVLLNGRRLPPGGTGADISVDFSSIPANVVERIEVLKDGASAIYGSDAIAGVVNVITRKRYSGAEADVYGSTTTKADGAQIDANAVVGATNDKGGVMFSINYYNGQPAWAGNRPYSSIQRGLDLSGGGDGVPYDLGSGTIPGGRIVLSPAERGVPNGNSTYNDLIRTYPTANGLTRDLMTGQWRKFNGPTLSPGDGWNFQPYNYVVTPQERFTAFTNGDYQLDKYVRVFFDAFYTKRTSEQTLAPEPLVLDDEGVTVSGQNVYNPFGRDFAAVRRRLVEFGRRTFRQDINNFHLTAGLDGDLPESAGPFAGWFWEAVFNYNRNDSTEQKVGNVRVPRLRDAVGPSFVDNAGVARCGTPGAIVDGCVPLNLFGGPGSITSDMVSPLTFTGVQRGFNEVMGTQVNLGGELFHLAAKRAVGLAVGYEFRTMSGGQFPDPITAAGETSGNKVSITQGKYHVNEVYAELNAPLIEKMPVVEALELVAAGRASFYSNFGSTINYKLGARWAPMPDFAFRGTFSTAFRAPSIQELYQGSQDNFANITDPCANVAPGSALARNCGAAANNGDDRNQIRSHIGGNANLQPEKAYIFTAGLVVKPSFAKNFSLTVDYFNTLVKQTINGIGESTILQGCYPNAEGVAPEYCGLITRDPVSQRISNIQNLNQNVGRDHLDGIDFTGQYDLATPAGSFNLITAVSYLRTFDRLLADGTMIHGAGTFDIATNNLGGVGRAFPHFRFTAGVTWLLSGFSASLRTYFMGSYKECGDVDADLSGSGLCYAPDHKGERWVPAYNTYDLVLGYAFKNTAGLSSVSIGATNIFNAYPPRVYNGFAGTTDTYNYDMIGRQVYARLAHKF